jgi:hypothetical protein
VFTYLDALRALRLEARGNSRVGHRLAGIVITLRDDVTPISKGQEVADREAAPAARKVAEDRDMDVAPDINLPASTQKSSTLELSPIDVRDGS